MKVAVYAIAKNEEKFVDRWMDSVSEADAVYVNDTGSTDDTVTKLLKRGANVYQIPMPYFRFDVARNNALGTLPDDTDICVSLDLDEVLEPGWRAKLEAVWTKGTTRAVYQYNWSFNPDGSPAVQFFQNRIHSRHGYSWKYADHEIVVNDIGEENWVLAPITANHYPDNAKPRGEMNIKLLEIDVKERPDDPRSAHYLGREYMFHGRHKDAITQFTRYLELPGAVWGAERCATRRFLARCYSALGALLEAEEQCLFAISEAPYLREPYVDMAKVAYLQHDWEAVRYYAIRGLRCTDKTAGGYANDADAWAELPHDLIAVACWNLERYSEGIEHAAIAVEMTGGNDNRLTENLDFFLSKLGG